MRTAASLGCLVAGLSLAAGAAAAQPEYRRLPGGRFESALPQGADPAVSVPVQLRPYALRALPVTQAEFLEFVRRHPQWQRGRAPRVYADESYLADWKGPLELPGTDAADRPVTYVSWFAARAYCESEHARLPTWLQWEFAAAADATRSDARSDPDWQRRILAWYERPAGAAPAPVGGAADVHGIRDLHGLIWEWVEDYNSLLLTEDSRAQGDPEALRFCGAGASGILGRNQYAILMRVALLTSLAASDTTGALGFRCARSLPAEQP
jgi:formylglycine-generating enzyme required for sulfatase activity